MFIDVVQNIAILLSFAILYDYLWLRYEPKNSLGIKVVTGIVIGFIGIVLMQTPWILIEGLIFDVRSVLLSVTGLFFGTIPTLVAIILTALFRYWLGGAGMVMGVMVIVTSGLIGILWRKYIPDVFGKNRHWKILGMGLVVHLVMLACTIFLPAGIAINAFKSIAPATLTLYPMATVLLSALLVERGKKLKKEKLIEESEQRFRNLFENSQSVMLILDAEDGKILDANPAALKFYGYDYTTLTQMDIRQLCPFIEKDEAQVLEHSWQNDSYIRFQQRTATGLIREVEIYRSYIEYHNRRVIFAIIHDITERVQAVQKLRNLSHIIENALNELYIASADTFQIIEVNKGAVQNIGYPRDELQKLTLLNLMPSFTFESLNRIVQSLRTENDTVVLETNLRRKNGILFPVEVHLQKMQYGETPVIVVFVNDISQRKKSEQELIAAKNRAEESERLKSSFLANLSHEIRTPLNSIIGFSNLLKKGELSREKIELYSSIIASSGSQIAEIINETIEIAEIDAGTVKVELAPFNLNECLREIYTEMLALIAQHSPIKLTVFNENLDENFFVVGDKAKVSKILSNLISNAIKYTLEGFVSFGYTVEKDKLLFKIIDTGIGIEPDDLQRIFSRFYRAKNILTIKKPGIGLGMAIVQAYTELLHGKITIESEPRKGTTVLVELPYIPVFEETLTESGEEPTLNYKPIPRKILVAEDDEYNYLLMEEILTSAGYTCIRAANGKEALELFHTHRPFQLILVDLKMPEKDGFEIVSDIRSIDKQVPIVAVTAYAHYLNHDLKELEDFDEIITKPINTLTFINTIKKVLSTAASRYY